MKDIKGLTRIQRKHCEKIYDFCFDYIKEKHFPPSYKEIAAGTHLKSSASVKYYLEKMALAGMVTFDPVSSRSIVLKGCEYSIKKKMDVGSDKKENDSTSAENDKDTVNKA
jgi:SOS-response transcriptional repressor LexA